MEDNQDENRGWWRFFDGSVSVSASMLVAVLLSKCQRCAGLPVIGFMKDLTEQDSGVIVAATIMLFPMALTLFGGLKLYFAAREAYEKRKRARLNKEEADRKKAKAEGRAEGRAQIRAKLEKRGMLTPELAEVFEEEREA